MIDSPLIGLAEVIDPPLTFLLIVSPSLPSAPRDMTEGVLHLLSSPPLPLALYTRLEMGELMLVVLRMIRLIGQVVLHCWSFLLSSILVMM